MVGKFADGIRTGHLELWECVAKEFGQRSIDGPNVRCVRLNDQVLAAGERGTAGREVGKI